MFGWCSYHTKFSVKSDPGYPDDHLWHPEKRVSVFVEAKRNGYDPTPVQQSCIDSMRAAGLDVRVWRPSDWSDVVAFLSFGRAKAG